MDERQKKVLARSNAAAVVGQKPMYWRESLRLTAGHLSTATVVGAPAMCDSFLSW